MIPKKYPRIIQQLQTLVFLISPELIKARTISNDVNPHHVTQGMHDTNTVSSSLDLRRV
jgi:hypothetical protein